MFRACIEGKNQRTNMDTVATHYWLCPRCLHNNSDYGICQGPECEANLTGPGPYGVGYFSGTTRAITIGPIGEIKEFGMKKNGERPVLFRINYDLFFKGVFCFMFLFVYAISWLGYWVDALVYLLPSKEYHRNQAKLLSRKIEILREENKKLLQRVGQESEYR
jgi:hypothetical protein